ncbi:MAG: hypothetical protein AMJ75_05610 [Phycisphaerae bacterium SM1_79]|nr:MAG: hypothetical protein AMJ75_05610 [Phycisphaerae bacterium SM1_79]
MRVLLIVDCYLPIPKSAAVMIHELGVELAHRGHDVIVAAPDANLVAPNRITIEDGLTVLRVRIGQTKGTNKIIRAVNEVRLSSVIWKAGKKFFRTNPCDLIVFYSPTIFFGRLVQRLKEMWNCKAYLILRDIFPQWTLDVGVLRKGPAYWFFRSKELKQYSVADIIGVESPANLKYFSKNGLQDKCHLEVLYNWTALSGKKIVLRNYRRQLGLRDKVVFFYGGNIGTAQDMDNIVRLAKNLSEHAGIHFLLVGQGSEVPRLKAKIRKSELKNISIHPSLPQAQYLGMLSQCDVGLISLDRALKTCNIPGKILAYMYLSMPILASVNPCNDLKRILENSRAGLVCTNGQDEQLCNYALLLAKDVGLRWQMGHNARKVLEDTFCVSRAASQILSHIKDLPIDSK